MPFKLLQRSLYEKDEEVGLVYSRNKYGCVTSPPGYSLSRRESQYVSENPLKEASCSLTFDGSVFNPQSLYFICLDFVAKNIPMVESLQGFPDVVGEQLFTTVYQNGGFTSTTSNKNLELFCDAYGGLVLSKLSLQSNHMILDKYLDFLCLFNSITELDLSHCRMGDTHDMLTHIAHLTSLLRLSLKCNCLTDAGIRSLTLPQRLLKGGLKDLAVLDLSLNPCITDNSVKYFTKLRSLNALNLSGTGITFGNGIPYLVKNTSLGLALRVDEFHTGQSFTVTEGWAVDLVTSWTEKSKESVRDHTNDKSKVSCGKASNFYQSTRTDIVQKKNLKMDTVGLPMILLHSKGSNLVRMENEQKQKWNGSLDKPPKKKYKFSDDVQIPPTSSGKECFEENMVREYMSFENKFVQVKKTGSSLVELLDKGWH